MRSELKKVAIWSAMVFLLGMPLGVYLMSFSGEGLAGNTLFYVGAFVLLPWALLYKPLGMGMGLFVVACSPLLYLWFALWVALVRWKFMRTDRVAPGAAQQAGE